MKNLKVSVVINLTWLKMIASLVVLVGLMTFVQGCREGKYVAESFGVITLGLGTLGGRKYLISKDKANGNIQ